MPAKFTAFYRQHSSLWLAALCLTAALLSGCAGARSWQPAVAAAPDRVYTPPPGQGSAVVDHALEMVGKPYRYGSRGPESFDCSGLVWFSFRQIGVEVPRTSAAQYRATRRIALTDAKPGDLLFFGSPRKINHVAIYMGNQQFVHAPSSGRTVSVADFGNSWYRSHFVAAGRLPGS